MSKISKLTAAGFPAAQIKALEEAFGTGRNDIDIPRIGVADADDEESAIKLANACKARLNELIDALKG